MIAMKVEKSEGTPPVPASLFAGFHPSYSWTLDDLDRLPEDGRRYEIIDGSLFVSPSPGVTHQFYVGWLYEALRENVPDGCFTLPGHVDVLLPAEPARLVVPDVVAGDGVDLDAELRYLESSDLRLVVEVVSPGSATHDRFTKPVLYAAAGIPAYLRVEIGADGPTVHVHHLTDRGEGGAAYAETCVVRPGETVALDRPWKVTLTPPRRPNR